TRALLAPPVFPTRRSSDLRRTGIFAAGSGRSKAAALAEVRSSTPSAREYCRARQYCRLTVGSLFFGVRRFSAAFWNKETKRRNKAAEKRRTPNLKRVTSLRRPGRRALRRHWA